MTNRNCLHCKHIHACHCWSVTVSSISIILSATADEFMNRQKAENYIKHQTDMRSLSVELKWDLGYLLLQWVIEHPTSEAAVDDFGSQLPQVRPCETLSVHLDNVHRRRHNQKNTVAEQAGQGYVICQTVSTFEKGIFWNCQISCVSTII